MNKQGEIIQGGVFEDARGRLSYFNDFDMQGIRRLYTIEHPDIAVIRAWQGHKKEQKWFYVVKGIFRIVLIRPDNWENPSADAEPEEYVLAAADAKILHIPGNYMNGFKALEAGSRVIVFSNFTTEESAGDNYRFPPEMWYDWSK